MIPSLKKYFWLARFSYLDSVAYFGDFVARMFTIFLRIWIFTQLYQFTYRSYGLQEAGGLTLPMLIWSLMIVQSLGSTSWLSSARVIETEVKSGQIAYSLGRPYSYLGYHYAQFWGRAVLTIGINLIFGALIVVLLVGPINLSVTSIFAGLVMAFLGITLNFLATFIIGLSALWVEDISAFSWIYGKGVMIFGGMIVPLTLFPNYIQKIAEYLPFSQLYYGASRMVVSLDWSIFSRYLATQIFWLVIFGGLAKILLDKGIKHVAVNCG